MTDPALFHFLSGAAATASGVVALFFVRFYRKTHERIFGILATAFALLAAERIILLGVDLSDERRGFVYVIRLVAFLIILAGVADKSRSAALVRHRARGLPRERRADA